MENKNLFNSIRKLIDSDKGKYLIAGMGFLVVILLFFLFQSGIEEEPPLPDDDHETTDINDREDVEDTEEEDDLDSWEDNEDETVDDFLDKIIKGERERKTNPETGKEYDVIVYTGRDTQEMRVEGLGERHTLFYIQGNEEEKHFRVTGYTEAHTFWGGGELTRIFVNTFSSYEGILLDPGGRTRKLEIEAEGPWKVEVLSLNSARVIEVPGEVEGVRGEVLRIEGDSEKAVIRGNLEVGHEPKNFEVNAINHQYQSLVRTTDVYEGTVQIPRDTAFLEVVSDNRWKINLE